MRRNGLLQAAVLLPWAAQGLSSVLPPPLPPPATARTCTAPAASSPGAGRPRSATSASTSTSSKGWPAGGRKMLRGWRGGATAAAAAAAGDPGAAEDKHSSGCPSYRHAGGAGRQASTDTCGVERALPASRQLTETPRWRPSPGAGCAAAPPWPPAVHPPPSRHPPPAARGRLGSLPRTAAAQQRRQRRQQAAPHSSAAHRQGGHAVAPLPKLHKGLGASEPQRLCSGPADQRGACLGEA